MSANGTLLEPLGVASQPATEKGTSQSPLLTFFAVVVVVQGVHVLEHVIQLLQVHVLGVPEDDALGLLGYVFEFHGTEEWLHLVFNSLFLGSLWVLAWALLRGSMARVPHGRQRSSWWAPWGSRRGTWSSTV